MRNFDERDEDETTGHDSTVDVAELSTVDAIDEDEDEDEERDDLEYSNGEWNAESDYEDELTRAYRWSAFDG